MVESSSESGSSDSDSEFAVTVTRAPKNSAILETAAQIEQRTPNYPLKMLPEPLRGRSFHPSI